MSAQRWGRGLGAAAPCGAAGSGSVAARRGAAAARLARGAGARSRVGKGLRRAGPVPRSPSSKGSGRWTWSMRPQRRGTPEGAAALAAIAAAGIAGVTAGDGAGDVDGVDGVDGAGDVDGADAADGAAVAALVVAAGLSPPAPDAIDAAGRCPSACQATKPSIPSTTTAASNPPVRRPRAPARASARASASVAAGAAGAAWDGLGGWGGLRGGLFLARRRHGQHRRRSRLRHRRRPVRPFQQRPELRDVLRPRLRPDRQRGVDRVQERRAVSPGMADRQRLQGVVHHAAGRCDGRAAGDRVVDHAGQRVEVGPWTLQHRAAVLLDRREVRFQEGGQRLGLVADHPPRRAEVEQQRTAGGEQDVVRRDVAMEALRRMQHRHRVEQGVEPGAQLRFRSRSAERGQRGLQGRPFVEGHRHVGGTVGFPEAEHLDQRRMVEAGQQPRLVDEALQPGLEGRPIAVVAHRDLEQRAAAHRQLHRHVFLDRDMPFQRAVPGQVDDAEAALAQRPQDAKALDDRAIGHAALGKVAPRRGRALAPGRGEHRGVVAGRRIGVIDVADDIEHLGRRRFRRREGRRQRCMAGHAEGGDRAIDLVAAGADGGAHAGTAGASSNARTGWSEAATGNQVVRNVTRCD